MDLIERQAAEEALYDWEMCYTWDEHCREDYDSPYIVSPTKVIEALPSAEPETSRIEQELHGKTPEEQYEFIYWLLFKSALGYSNSRLTIIEWLRGGKEDG